MLDHNNIIQKVSSMKGKRQKKPNDVQPCEKVNSKSDTPTLLKIKFNISTDSLACFVGEKKNHKKRVQVKSFSLKKARKSVPKSQNKPLKPRKITDAQRRHHMTECEEIVQGSLNTILSEIESKGIDCQWNEADQAESLTFEENFQSQASQLWSAFSVNQSLSKSYASTVDIYPTLSYYADSYSAQTYYYNYTQKSYYDGNVFDVQLENILNDSRTTIMIRNIPNKYTIKQLSEEIDIILENTYDFLYLPCDIKNQCNVGYGFINFLNTQCLLHFYQRFQGKRWARFRSEKICNLTYARLQGLSHLIEHFENSKVQKDKKYRPIIRQFGKIQTLIKSQQLN